MRTTSPPSRAECHEIWEPKPPGILWATTGLLRDSFTLPLQVCKETSKNYIIINIVTIVMKEKNFILTIQLNFFFIKGLSQKPSEE
jgi:hypothetical protein